MAGDLPLARWLDSGGLRADDSVTAIEVPPTAEEIAAVGLTPEQLAIVDQITESLINKILHNPITQLKGMAHDPRGADFAETVRQLFNIKPSTSDPFGPSKPSRDDETPV